MVRDPDNRRSHRSASEMQSAYEPLEDCATMDLAYGFTTFLAQPLFQRAAVSMWKAARTIGSHR